MLLHLLVKLFFMIAVEEIIKENTLMLFVCVFTVSLNCNFVLMHRANIIHTCLSFQRPYTFKGVSRPSDVARTPGLNCRYLNPIPD